MSGNHAAIARWRRKQALGRTWAAQAGHAGGSEAVEGRPAVARRIPQGAAGGTAAAVITNKPRASRISMRLYAKGRKAGTGKEIQDGSDYQKLEQEEIKRLNRKIPEFRPRRHRHREGAGGRRRQEARAGLRRRGDRQAQPGPQFQLHRAQDLQRRRRGAHVPDLFARGRLHRGEAQGRRAPRQALLPARPHRARRRASGEARERSRAARCCRRRKRAKPKRRSNCLRRAKRQRAPEGALCAFLRSVSARRTCRSPRRGPNPCRA